MPLIYYINTPSTQLVLIANDIGAWFSMENRDLWTLSLHERVIRIGCATCCAVLSLFVFNLYVNNNTYYN